MKKQGQKSQKSMERKPRPQTTLDAFLVKCVREKKIRPEQTKEIAVFIREMKLRDKEDPETYEAALAKY